MRKSELDFVEIFEELSSILRKYRDIWAVQPFKYLRSPWADSRPELERAISQLTLDDVFMLDQSPRALAEFLERFIPESGRILQLVELFEWKGPERLARISSLQGGIFSRIRESKVPQIIGFGELLAGVGAGSLGMEWCSGKGHLARYLSLKFGVRVRCVEREEQLCESGRSLAEEFGLPLEFYPRDVLIDPVEELFGDLDWAVALHACGPLHRKFIELSSRFSLGFFALAPCCYFADAFDNYEPFSSLGRGASLPLNRDNLRLATQENIRKKRGRDRSRLLVNQWRLGFDILQRELRGVDQYLRIPSLPRRYVKLGFAGYCEKLAELVGIRLPPGLDFEKYRRLGERRYLEFAPRELPRLLFRRALEIWLILDRALFLLEQGFSVKVLPFTPREATPRNLAIVASS